jgi:hypothetical protein
MFLATADGWMKAVVSAWSLGVGSSATDLAQASTDRLAHHLGEPTHMALAMVASAVVVGVVWIVLARTWRRA